MSSSTRSTRFDECWIMVKLTSRDEPAVITICLSTLAIGLWP
jgi:hypothetical protein